MSRISQAFAQGKALIPFLTCGDPDLETTRAAVLALAQAGAGMIQLGIPFSDPTAEGPVIQAASARALAAGVTTDKVLELVRGLREETDVPLVLVTYANVVFSYGTQRFLAQAAAAGADGLMLPDVPYEEKEEFAPACREHGLAFLSAVAPTSRDRIAMIAREAEGFLSCAVSLDGTEAPAVLAGRAADMAAQAKAANPALPCVVSFEGSDPAQGAALAHTADGVIVGPAIVTLVQRYGREAIPHIRDYIVDMKAALSRP